MICVCLNKRPKTHDGRYTYSNNVEPSLIVRYRRRWFVRNNEAFKLQRRPAVQQPPPRPQSLFKRRIGTGSRGRRAAVPGRRRRRRRRGAGFLGVVLEQVVG